MLSCVKKKVILFIKKNVFLAPPPLPLLERSVRGRREYYKNINYVC